MIIDRIPSELRADVSVAGARADRIPSDLRTDVTSTSDRSYGRVTHLNNAAWRRRMLFVDLEHARQPQDQSIPAAHADDQHSLGVLDPGCDSDDILYRDEIANGGLFQ
jgi:hypothetical protein